MKNYSRGVHFFTQRETFEQGVQELLEKSRECGGKGTIARINVFGRCADNKEYEQNIELLERMVVEMYGKRAPLVSYVTQPVLIGGTYAAEVQIFDVEIDFKELNGLRYFTMESADIKRLALGGVIGSVTDSIRAQSDSIFERIKVVFEHEGFEISEIFRQWNYIPQITAVDENNYQNYQAFNDSRTEFYREADWSEVGYPAATGIGMDCGAVTVNLIAVKLKNSMYRVIPVDNSLQQAAHVYSQEVLIGVDGDKIEGKSTPKFERAKVLGNPSSGYICFISGTAAIRGEESMESDDAATQTIQTMENIEHLISDETYERYCIEPKSDSIKVIHLAHTYIKYAEDAAAVERVVSQRWADTTVLYLHADVCRDELLVEIEAISTLCL